MPLASDLRNRHASGDFSDKLGRSTIFSQNPNITTNSINQSYEKKNATTLHNIEEVEPYITECHNCTENSKTFFTNNTIHVMHENKHAKKTGTVISRQRGFPGDSYDKVFTNPIKYNNVDRNDKIEKLMTSRFGRETEEIQVNFNIKKIISFYLMS